jgi:hypothetical protein
MRYREILEACWTGYHKEGMKTMFGRRYPNCVKNKKTNEDQISNEKVRRIQNFLNDKFDANLDVDGVLGPLTIKSIDKFMPDAQKRLAPEPDKTTRVQGLEKKLDESELEEDLRKWFKEKWVRFGPDGKIRGDCARGSSKEGKPKCLPQSKAHALGKKGRASAAAKKRREDPNPERRGAAKNVATKVGEEQLDELKFLGSECTKDCSGHRAGYNWSRARGGVDGMSPWSPSFNKGAALAKAGK